MADDDILKRYYGAQPADFGPEGDRNSLGYALQGPAPALSTSDTLQTMAAHRAAQEREGPEAAARIAATLLGLGAARLPGAATSQFLQRAGSEAPAATPSMIRTQGGQ